MRKKTETSLCVAFMELLRKYPFPKITIQKIAEQCGVNRQTFYYYYDNIYDLMARAFEYELLRESRMDQETSWEAAMERFLYWMKNNRIIIKNMLVNVESSYMRRAIYPVVRQSMNCTCSPCPAVEEQETENEEFLRHFLVIGITQYILEWIESDYKESVDEVIRKLYLVIKKIYE